MSTIIGLDWTTLVKLFTNCIGLYYIFYFSYFNLEDSKALCDWHYFNSLMSANDVLGLIFAVICEYLDVWVPLLKPELVALLNVAEL